jgi:hypothetical protein
VSLILGWWPIVFVVVVVVVRRAGMKRHWPCDGRSQKSANWETDREGQPENSVGCIVRAGHVARTLSPLLFPCLLSRSPI